jgi:PH (Pleckstrin Homology) domain-containing protein/putative oligomerization/nucleic acid binding protein
MAETLRPDIEAARNRLETKIGAGREMKRLPEYLWDGEQVDLMAAGTYGPGQGLVVMTDRRLLFVKDGVMQKTTEDFPFDKVSSVQWTSGMVFGTLTIFASGNKAEIKNMNKRDGKPVADALRERLASRGGPSLAPAPVAQTAPSPSSDEVFAKLRQLGDLRDAGIVTPQEFESKKAELLDRL